MCGSVPATAMAQIKAPSTVELTLSTVESVRLSSRSTPPPRTSTPQFTGTGSLLGGGCSSPSYTLVDFGSTVFWAGFVGCINDRPECCPWTVGNTVAIDAGPVTQGGGVNTSPDNIGAAFPTPKDGVQLVLSNCADDYYSVSGSCCPNGFFPFTRAVAGQTPCWSSMNRVTAAPTLTANVVGQPTDTDKPTSAVLNVVWAIQYAVAPQDGGSKLALPVGAIVGISVGGAAIISALVLAWFCIRRRRRKAENEKEGAGFAPRTSMAAVPTVPVMASTKSGHAAPAETTMAHHDDGSGGMFTPRASMRQQQQQYDPLPTASPPRKTHDGVAFQQQPQQYQQQNNYHHHGRHSSSATTWSAGGRPESEISGMSSPGAVFVPHYQDGATGHQQQQHQQTAYGSPPGTDERTYWQHG
ncbi:hypothetical protein MAPG_10005 [Magnaporthiopsis poae ATCC 64411]|uniref:Uncharacterized protein n=1 Tax=Magnaporthiopsis poae (strain ATCC 64411 / 73-15) TaxID=644358 RepID=A0A0C4EBF8_MAGP6|nr:hypothetical protein MAPG_10005 [Magnaporthiopsis poae ATCC 64411]